MGTLLTTCVNIDVIPRDFMTSFLECERSFAKSVSLKKSAELGHYSCLAASQREICGHERPVVLVYADLCDASYVLQLFQSPI